MVFFLCTPSSQATPSNTSIARSATYRDEIGTREVRGGKERGKEGVRKGRSERDEIGTRDGYERGERREEERREEERREGERELER